MPVALLSLALAMAITGSNVVVGKLLAQALPVPVILFIRCVLAALILAPVGLRPNPQPPRGWVLGNIAAQALGGTVLYNVFLLAGLRTTGALQAGIVLSSLPAVVALAAAMVLRERLAARRWIAVGLAAGGVALVAAGRSADLRGTVGGDALVLLAVACEASFVLLSRLIANRFPAARAIFWVQAASALMLLPFAAPRFAGAWPALASPRLLALLAYHAVSASVLCNLLWYAGMRRVPASLAGIFTIFLPVTAAILALFVLHERFVPALAVGFTLALASLVVATWPARATPATQVRSEAMVMRSPE